MFSFFRTFAFWYTKNGVQESFILFFPEPLMENPISLNVCQLVRALLLGERRRLGKTDANRFAARGLRFGFLSSICYGLIRRGKPRHADCFEERTRMPLQREEIALVVLSLAKERSFTPVQIERF
jgi:hypothetical protein